MDVSTIANDKPILVDWIKEVWRILDKYWKNGVPIYALKPMRELNIEDCAEAILIDLKDYGFYL